MAETDEKQPDIDVVGDVNGPVEMRVTGDPGDEAKSRMNPVWPQEMLKVFYTGALLYPTGYGEACRSNVKALKRVGVGVMARLNQVPHPGLANELITGDHEINEALDKRFWPENVQPDAYIWHSTPEEFRRIPGKHALGYAVWECEGLPYNWAQHCNQMDGLLTCSEFSKGLFERGGVGVPIGVCPHPIDLDRFNPGVDGVGLRATFGECDTLFLVVSQWMFRKSIENVVAAYSAEFTPDDKVGMVLLAWQNLHTFEDRMRIKSYTQAVVDSLNLVGGAPPIWHIGDNLPPESLPALYAAADVYVIGSRAEAFNLPAFEAAACGKPTISTGWGGMWDFLDDESAYRVPYVMETVHGAGPKWRHYHSGQQWARPSLDGMRTAMRQAHEDPEGRKAKGRAAFQTVADNLTYTIAGKRMQNEIQKILDMGPPK